MDQKNVAVLIDFENVGDSSLDELFDTISDIGRTIIKRAYADWSQVKQSSVAHLQKLGIEAIQNFHASNSAKNSSDIRLAIDAIELVYRSDVDSFVIVSADSDFVPLVNQLRASGKTVVGAGRQDVVSPSLVRSCDRYIFLKDKSRARISKDLLQLNLKTEELALRALRVSGDEDGRVVGSKLHQNMLQIDPSFDFRAMGFRTFTSFLNSLKNLKITKKSRGPGDVLVEEMQ
jgi:uncharacterized protein (TIGR00288 family)